jgi:acetyltransferase-like isoleucine patch superfamily enzyme
MLQSGDGGLQPSVIDDGVLLNYPSSRASFEPLELGEGARLRSGTVLYAGSVIGARFQTGHNVVVREDNHLDDDVSVWSNTVIDYGCRIGRGAKIHCHCYVAQFTVLGEDVFFAPGVSVANDLYPGDPSSARLMRGPEIGAGAQIGVNVTILPFVKIGAGALVGSGSVVTRDIPPDCVAYGNPARPRGTRAGLIDISERVNLLEANVPELHVQTTSLRD